MNANITSATQTIEVASKPGRSFLRKLIREVRDSQGDWTARASHLDKNDYGHWRLLFEKTIRGEIGDPDVTVTVLTDAVVEIRGEFGDIQSFSDSKKVYVPAPTKLRTSSLEAGRIAQCLLDGASLRIEGSGGSTASSQYGIGFATLRATYWSQGMADIDISQSTYVNGIRVILGSIE